jgi:MFS family permease
MVLAPRLVARYGEKVSARVRLTVGLLICFAGNIFFWRAAEGGATYGIFIFGMLVGGVGAGILNGETVKVMGSAVPPERAGMASGLASTTRFIGILVGTAVLGAVLASTLRHQFLAAAARFNVDGKITDEAVRLISAGNAIHAIQILPAPSREALSAVGMHAFAHGFGAGALVAAIAAAMACALTFWFVRPDGAAAEKAALESDGHCQLFDCRHPI